MPLLHLNDTVRDDSNRSYKVTRRLGEGQFAEVWEVRLPGTDLHVSSRPGLQEAMLYAAAVNPSCCMQQLQQPAHLPSVFLCMQC